MKVEEKLPRREREKLAHRQEILEAAKRVFAKKGFHATTIDEIAEEAEFSKGALYVHFNNKEGLFLSLIQEKSDQIEARLREVAEGSDDPETKIRNLVTAHLTFFEEDKDFFQIMASERPRLGVETESELRKGMRERYLRYLDLIESVMEEGVSRKVLKAIDTRLLAISLIGMIHSFTAQWILLGKSDPLSEMESVILELFFEGSKKV